MAYLRDVSLSVRENILRHLVDRFETRRDGTAAFLVAWDTVQRQRLDKLEAAVGCAVGLLEGKERKQPRIGETDCFLQLDVEFVWRVEVGGDPAQELNRLLADVQRTVCLDITCGGLSVNVLDQGSQLDTEVSGDGLAWGIATFELQYKHRVNDPLKMRGD